MPEAGAALAGPVPTSPRAKPAAKAVSQVMAALKYSRSTAGPTMTDIVKFISGALHKPATKRQVVTALKRGVEFGILKRKRGHYLISSPEEDLTEGAPVPTAGVPARKGTMATSHKRRRTRNRASAPGGRIGKRQGQSSKRRRKALTTTAPMTQGQRLRDVFRARPSAVSSATTLADPDSFDFYA